MQERAVEDLYSLELSYEVDRDGDCWTNRNLNTENEKLNPEATKFRPKRNATAIEENKPPQVEWLKNIDTTPDNKRFQEPIFHSYN